MIYFILFFILLLISINIDFLKKNIGKKLVYILLCLILIIFSSVRYRVGGDTLNYIQTYKSIPNIFDTSFIQTFNNQRAEIGWYFLSGIGKLISEDFMIMQTLQAIIVNVCMFIFIKRYTRHIFLGVLYYFVLFYLYFNFEILRESLAISIFIIFGINFLLQKKYFLYIIVCAFAMLFHTSASVLFFVPIVYHFIKKYKFNYYIYFTIIYIVGTILSSSFYSFLGSGGFLSIFSNKFETYIDYDFTIFGRLMAYFLYVLLPAYTYNKSDKSIFSKLLLVYAFIGSLTGLFPIFFRFVNYFTPVFIICITNITYVIFNQKRSRLRFENGLMFIFFITFFFNYKILNTVDVNRNIKWYSWWYPYNSIFNKQEDPDREYIWAKQFN